MEIHYRDTAKIDESRLKQIGSGLIPYLRYLGEVGRGSEYNSRESSIILPFDEDISASADTLAQSLGGKGLRSIVVIGIGGSSMGARAIYDARLGYFDVIERERSPKMFFLEDANPAFLGRILSMLIGAKSPEEFLVNVISESGKTLETAANTGALLSQLEKHFGGAARERLVVTTKGGSPLEGEAMKRGLSVLVVPQRVGGRFSVFSPVGLFPLSLAGLDIKGLRTGAQEMRDRCLSEDFLNNPAAVSAALRFLHYQGGKFTNVNFFFDPELESLGGWLTQLIAESVGKERDIDGKEVRDGITPITSIGSRDLHSLGQLYFGGPRDKFTVFVKSTLGSSKEESGGTISSDTFTLLPELSGKTVTDVKEALFQGARSAYRSVGLPYMDIELGGTDEPSLGAFMQFAMIEVMCLAYLMRVNAFDQPAVELYKEEARRVLGL